MGESGLLVTFGQGISEAANEKALRLAQSFKERPLSGAVDVVPAYSSTLILFEPEALSAHDLEDEVRRRLSQKTTAIVQGRLLEIPVQYNEETGPDLANLAQLHGLTQEDVIRLHTGRQYRVFFIGFMPGFPYMGRVARRLITPRLPTPRVRVAAGSVGIAGSQTGIYPLASPGGWQIIGRTRADLWDPTRESPSLLLPGDSVQFLESAAEGERVSQSAVVLRPQRPVLEVTGLAGMSTVQDLGREGYSQLGLCRGGAFDPASAMRANALVGNAPSDAVLELTWSGPTMQAVQNITIALDGADLGCRVDGATVPPGMAWFVRSGSTVRFSQSSPSRAGARAYLAVAGGLDAPLVLKSRSTYLPGGFGGIGGRPIQVGDNLGVVSQAGSAQDVAGRFWIGRTGPPAASRRSVRFVRYTGAGRANNHAMDALVSSRWTVSDSSDRMGLRLRAAESMPTLPVREVVSFGVVKGAIQLPPDGNPVVLGPDHHTTGGYPLAGVVIEADLPILAQLRPGDEISFQDVSLAEALVARATARRELREGIAALNAPR